MKFYKFGILGYGNMAQAILRGVIKSGACKKSDISVYDVNVQKLNDALKNGFNTAVSAGELFKSCKYILFAVKPQNACEIFTQNAEYTNFNIIISIMAGVTIKKIHKELDNIKVCRCMPNTPALILKGVTAIDSHELSAQEKAFVYNIFDSVGDIIEIEEGLMNAVTAVSGSGPAYVYMFIKYYIEAAMSLGLTMKQSKKLVLSTVKGSAEMIECGGCIDDLIQNVCSKGGTTIEGVNVLKNAEFDKTIKLCIKAAFDRAEELSQ